MKNHMLFNKLAMIILIIAFSVTKNEVSYAQYEEEVETTNGQNQQSESVDHSSPQQTAPSQSETSIRPEDAPATSQIILPREDARDGHSYSPFYRGFNLDHAIAQLKGEMVWRPSEWSRGVTRQVMIDGIRMQIQRYVDAGLISLPGGSSTVTEEHVQYALRNLKMYQPHGQLGNTGWDEKAWKRIPYFETVNGNTTIGGFSFPGSKYNFAILKMGTGTKEGRVENPCVNNTEMITPNPEYAPPITKVETIAQTEVYERVDTAFVHTTDTLIQTVETERVEFVEVPVQQGGAMMSGGFSMGMSAGFMGPQQPGYIDNSFYYVDNSYVDNTYIEGDTYITNPPPPVDPAVVPPTGNPTLPPNYPPSDENPQPPTDGNPPEPVGHNPWTDGIPVSDPTDGTGGGPTYGGGKGVKGNNSSPSVALEGTFFSPGTLANTGSNNSIPKPMAPKENNGPVKGDILSVQSDPKPMNPKGSIPSAPIKGNTPKSENNNLALSGPTKGNTPTSSTYSDPKPSNPTTGPVKGNVPKSNIIPPSKPVTPKTQTPIQVKDNTPKSNNPDPRPMNPVTASNQSTHSKPNTGGWGYNDYSGGTKGPSRGNTSGVTPKGNNTNSTPRSETPSIAAAPKNNPETTTDNARVAGGTKSVKQQSVRPDRGNSPQVKTPAKKNSPQVKSKPRQQPKVAKPAPRSKPQARPQGGSQSRSSRQR